MVYLATMLAPDNASGRRLAIKFMASKSQYEREITSRKGLDTRLVLGQGLESGLESDRAQG